jgi:hypothetical protein
MRVERTRWPRVAQRARRRSAMITIRHNGKSGREEGNHPPLPEARSPLARARSLQPSTTPPALPHRRTTFIREKTLRDRHSLTPVTSDFVATPRHAGVALLRLEARARARALRHVRTSVRWPIVKSISRNETLHPHLRALTSPLQRRRAVKRSRNRARSSLDRDSLEET